MELITILNRCHRFRGFVYEHARFSADRKSIEVVVRPRKGSAADFVTDRGEESLKGFDRPFFSDPKQSCNVEVDLVNQCQVLASIVSIS